MAIQSMISKKFIHRKRKEFFLPSRLMVLSFALVIFIGTFFLFMDGAGVPGTHPSLSDSFFMATSAVCVTGLSVCDTGSAYSSFGQLVILVLIQLGGLGILTFSNLLVLFRRRRADMSKRMLLEESHGILPSVSPRALVRSIIIYTTIIEGTGAIVLSLRFYSAYTYSLKESLWLGIFHSISAFCNAGFSLFSNSFVGFSDDWIINFTLMFLIILGGLGFVVLADIRNRIKGWRKGWRMRLSLHSRVVLWTSLIVMLSGMVLFYLMELTGEAIPDSFLNHFLDSLFLSVTARTAGFNTVDMAHLTNASLLILILLMYIGGSPGSTAGGFKITSFATIIALLSSKVRNRPHTEIMERRLPEVTVGKALATVIGFSVFTVLAVMLLQVTELFGVPHSEHRGAFLEYLFEVVSALCTVGLSTGITTSLSSMGRLVIIVCMFTGRLGPILLANSLIGTRKRLPFSYAQEDILVG